MDYLVELEKFDRQQFNGGLGYVVFSPPETPVGVRARPKFTISPEDWRNMGHPIQLNITAAPIESVEHDRTTALQKSLVGD